MNDVRVQARTPRAPAQPELSLNEAALDVQVFAADAFGELPWPRAADLGQWHGFLYQTYEFLKLWMETIGLARGSDCRFVVVSSREGEPLMCLPLCLERRLSTYLLRFMDGGVADYNGPLVRCGWKPDPRAFPALWKLIHARLPRFDAVELRKIASPLGRIPNPLAQLPRPHGIDCGLVVEIDRTWEAYLAEPSRRRYHAVTRRKLRALERRGAVSFSTVTSPDEADEVRNFLFRHKRKQYLRTIGADVFALPGYVAFFERMSSPPLLGSIGHLSVLRCDADIVAAHLGYRTADRFHQIMPAYDAERYANASGGRLLLDHLLRESFAQRLAGFDFGEGTEAYKRVWATGELQLSTHSRGRTFKGRLALRLNQARRTQRQDKPKA